MQAREAFTRSTTEPALCASSSRSRRYVSRVNAAASLLRRPEETDKPANNS